MGFGNGGGHTPGYLKLSEVIRGYQKLSEVIRSYQKLSKVIAELSGVWLHFDEFLNKTPHFKQFGVTRGYHRGQRGDRQRLGGLEWASDAF